MRRAQGGQFVYEGGQVIGLEFGADYVAEHECGIEDLQHEFGIPLRPTWTEFGIEARRITNVPERLSLLDWDARGTMHRGIIFDDYRSYKHRLDKAQIDSLQLSDPKDNWWRNSPPPESRLITAWKRNSFGFLVHTETLGRDILAISDLYDAFLTMDLAMWASGNQLSGSMLRGGLVLAIVSRVPEKFREHLKDQDQNQLALDEAAHLTGLVQRVNEARGQRQWPDWSPFAHFSLRPAWVAQKQSALNGAETTYPVCFWLNPLDQKNQKAGYYTVEQLDEWLAGRGPVYREVTQ